ncbi:thioesterase family protein [Glutamicibacter endophyticus]|uniref:thioesterase family protein n=1 Tax=Glutamicibacter endophyticus TaxID=1522174 RepID=UPI003AF180E2
MTHPAPENLADELAVGGFYYQRLGAGRFRSSIHAQGAWNEHEQHMGPASGILTHELANFQPRDEMRLSRLSFDILGIIPGGEFEIRTRMLRPGRTIELLEAELVAGGRTSIIARAWRIIAGDSSAVSGTDDAWIPTPEQCVEVDITNIWPGGYIRSLEIRHAPETRPGHGIVWVRNPLRLLDSENTSDMVRLIGMVDTANGVAPRATPGAGSWMFPNVDLQIHLYRQPQGQWLGFSTKQAYGAEGIGLTSSVLHDELGPFGHSEQILTVRPL